MGAATVVVVAIDSPNAGAEWMVAGSKKSLMTEIQSDLEAGRRTEKARWRGKWKEGHVVVEVRVRSKQKKDAQNFPVFPVSHDTYSPLPPQNPSTTASSPSTHPRPAAQRISLTVRTSSIAANEPVTDTITWNPGSANKVW